MASCKDCMSEKVCKYNDKHNLYCKENYECPHFKNKADFVEVVRCKDCRFFDMSSRHCDHPMSTSIPISRSSTGYCSYGERKENK